MRITVYGGSFNPPHMGHIHAAEAARKQLKAKKMLVIPDYAAPHKDMAANSPTPEQRLELARLSFAGIPGAEVSDIELRRGGRSYTCETLRQLMEIYPGAEFTLLMGTDMLLGFEKWVEYRWILENAALAVFPRDRGEEAAIDAAARSLREKYGARVERIETEPLPAASSDIRAMLAQRQGRELLHPEAYARIIASRLYGAKPEWEWLRSQAYEMLKPKRVAHVQGCEKEAIRLAQRWGADPELAAEAAICHDITKKLDLKEQLILCEKYGIIPDNCESGSAKLLHAITGAAVAEERFGLCREASEAVRWHTTGRPDMALLEKILYLADYIEPTRDFEGLEELRRLAYEDIDAALALGFAMSLAEVEDSGETAHPNTKAALAWYSGRDKTR